MLDGDGPGDQGWMICPEPGDDIGAEFPGEGAEFVRFGRADGASGVVFGGVALYAAGFQIVGIIPSRFPPAKSRRRISARVLGKGSESVFMVRYW